MKSKNETVKAIILHSRAYQESSMIMQVFSFERGIFSIIAKGVKGKKAQAKKAILQPFQLLSLEITGKSSLKILVACELELDASVNASLFVNKKLACAFYANEILLRALPERHEFPELFTAYCKLLVSLANSNTYSPLLREFEIVLLSSVGLAPDFNLDNLGNPILPELKYVLSPANGFTKATEIEHKDSVSGNSILALANNKIEQSSIKECEKICRQLIRGIVGDKPLQSRKLWQHSGIN